MKCLILAVLLVIAQTQSPPRKATDSAGGPGHSDAKNASDTKALIAPASPTVNPESTPPSVKVRELPPVLIVKDWSEWGIWVFNLFLVVVGMMQVWVLWRQAGIMTTQAGIMTEHATHLGGLVTAANANAEAARATAIAAEDNASSLINSERAWVIAELVPVCVKFGNWWHRPAGNGWAALSQEEVTRGDHLKHKLKFTNMGRTPAHILSFQIGYSCLLEGVTDLPEGTSGDIVEAHPFDQLLAAAGAIEVLEPIIDVDWYLNSNNSIETIRAIRELKNTAVFHGWVRYQHVFSSNDVIEEPFCYFYGPQNMRLNRVVRPKAKQGSSGR
jgi:hypothetical protein